MTLEGTGRQIAPNLDVFGELGPIFEEVVKKRYTPDRIGLELLRRAEKLGFLAQGLPERADDLLEDLRFGRLSIRTVDPSRSSSNDRFGRRIQIGMLVGSLTLMSALLLAVHRDRLGAAAFALATLTWLGHVGRDFWRSFSDRA